MSTAPLSVRRTVESTSDPDEAHEFLRRMYSDRVGFYGSPRSIRFEAEIVQFGEVSVGTVDYSGAVRIQLPQGVTRPSVVQPFTSEICLDMDRRPVTVGAGDVVYIPPERAYAFDWEHLHASVVQLDPVGLRATGADATQSEALTGLATSGAALRRADSSAAQFWARTVSTVRDGVLTLAPDSGPLAVQAWVDVLCGAAAMCFLGPGSGQPAPPPFVIAPASLRRAMAYVDEHVAQPIRVGDIAAAAGMSPRALQAAFRRHYDRTPLEQVRLARLDRAHADLVAGDASRGDTVRAIAARWGFTHPGRFTQTYRRIYRQLPSHTLREG